jgi:hydrogenase maturation protein HypF
MARSILRRRCWRRPENTVTLTASTRCRLRLRGIVQGVGFRPFVYRLARQHDLAGHVSNTADGVDIVVQGAVPCVDAFIAALSASPPPAARIAEMHVEATEATEAASLTGFHIRESDRGSQASTVVSPDLPVCEDCLLELLDQGDRRYRYPYITCTNCGPRFSLSLALPYDRESTTMAAWPMCADCEREYHDPADRRFHAQSIACPQCGPHYRLVAGETSQYRDEAIVEAARLLATGHIVGIKGIGGYHLACDATNAAAVGLLRERKFRKAQAFALMVRDLDAARRCATLSVAAELALTSAQRPIVLAPARCELAAVAPGHPNLGLMLPYTPVHHLLFASGAPEVLVMTSGNRSSEPIAFEDNDAETRLREIADALLIGERPIARRVDDSVLQLTPFGVAHIRRSRGLAPSAVSRLPGGGPILAVGGDLKNTIALAVDNNVLVSQHIGDLEHHATRTALARTIADFLQLYNVDPSVLSIAHDIHPEYVSTRLALEMPAFRRVAVQHHRAHIASVLAERNDLGKRVLGVAFDGTGFGDDGTIWGGEFFVGSVVDGFDRVSHLRPAMLPGGDGCAGFPVQAAAGFLGELDQLPNLHEEPFHFPVRYRHAVQLMAARVRVFPTTSAGRLFDATAALLGFARPVTFEAEAAIWLQHCASRATTSAAIPFEFASGLLDWCPAVRAIIDLRMRGEDVTAIALGFHRGLARGIAAAVSELCQQHDLHTVALSGGVFQNGLLLQLLRDELRHRPLAVWTNQIVPAGDGGLCLGQAAMASMCEK